MTLINVMLISAEASRWFGCGWHCDTKLEVKLATRQTNAFLTVNLQQAWSSRDTVGLNLSLS